MNELLHNLIEALREELKQYGEMLALLEYQQELVIRRQAPDLLQSVAEVEAQAEAIRMARREREQRCRHLARQLALDEAAGFQELTPQLPADYRPLVQALVQENNELLVRVQQRARQNHLLLSRAMELMQRFINTLVPGASPTTYTEVGLALTGAGPDHALYNAVG
ncbi:MAG TPA: flagellar protein FlgN [Bacillota bacterium]|nr:flagellar protein FlgN [Bacillota bacterium]